MIKSILCYIGTAFFFLLGIGTMMDASDGGGYMYVGGGLPPIFVPSTELVEEAS